MLHPVFGGWCEGFRRHACHEVVFFVYRIFEVESIGFRHIGQRVYRTREGEMKSPALVIVCRVSLILFFQCARARGCKVDLGLFGLREGLREELQEICKGVGSKGCFNKCFHIFVKAPMEADVRITVHENQDIVIYVLVVEVEILYPVELE